MGGGGARLSGREKGRRGSGSMFRVGGVVSTMGGWGCGLFAMRGRERVRELGVAFARIGCCRRRRCDGGEEVVRSWRANRSDVAVLGNPSSNRLACLDLPAFVSGPSAGHSHSLPDDVGWLRSSHIRHARTSHTWKSRASFQFQDDLVGEKTMAAASQQWYEFRFWY